MNKYNKKELMTRVSTKKLFLISQYDYNWKLIASYQGISDFNRKVGLFKLTDKNGNERNLI